MEVIAKKDSKETMKAGWMKGFKCSGDGNGGNGCGAPLLVSQADFYRKPTSLREREATGYIKKMTFCCPLCGVETDVDSPHLILFELFTHGNRPSQSTREMIPLM